MGDNQLFNSTYLNNRILWILLAFYLLYSTVETYVYDFVHDAISPLLSSLPDYAAFEMAEEGPRVALVAFILLVFLVIRKNRFLLETIRPSREKRSMSKLGAGLLIGFASNFFCILCALIHGDVTVYFEFAVSQIPLLLISFIIIFFQSTSEELWCRAFLYERINVHYPLWMAIVVNSVVFGLWHNPPDLTALWLIGLIISGVSISLLRWYTGSIWTCLGFHTMWNTTQNLIFSEPRYPFPEEAIFHLDATGAISNPVYDYACGVEGAVPSLCINLLICIVILMLAKKHGRLGELFESRESRGEMTVELPRSRSQKAIIAGMVPAAVIFMILVIVESFGMVAAPVWTIVGLLCVLTGLGVFLK